MTRIYHSGTWGLQDKICLSREASHHLLNVLRLGLGEKIIVFNGAGGEYEAELFTKEKRSAVVKILKFSNEERESPLKIHLAQGIARGEKMDFILQKATELGVSRITPLISEFANVRLTQDRMEKKLQHWRQVTISACEQSGRNLMPEIDVALNLSAWLPQQNNALKLILEPHSDLHLRDLPIAKSVCLLIGPEGGFSEKEIALAKQNGFQTLSLGPRILRTETAGLAAIAALQTLWGDF